MMWIRKWGLAGLCCLLISTGHAEVMLQDLQGHKIPFSSLQGKWVFINVWASWCQSCVDEIPALNHFYELNRESNIALFAVNYDVLSIAEQKNLVEQYGIHYPTLLDPIALLQLGEINGVPVTFVFNPEGKLDRTLYGKQTVKSLKQVIVTS